MYGRWILESELSMLFSLPYNCNYTQLYAFYFAKATEKGPVEPFLAKSIKLMLQSRIRQQQCCDHSQQ